MNVAAPVRRADDLAAALNPASIAIIGASDNPHKVGGRPLMYLSRFGYRGRVYPINPTRDRVQGAQAYPDLALAARGSGPRGRGRTGGADPGYGSRLRRPRRQGGHRHGLGLRRNPESRGTSDRGGHGRRRPRGGHAARRPEFAGSRELRHGSRRELLDDVRRSRAGGRPGRDRQPERRDERVAVRLAARSRHRHPARARDGKRRGRHAPRADLRGRARPRRPARAALHRVDPRSGAARAGRRGGARARSADRRGEVGPDRARGASGAIAHRGARQRRQGR